jgi:uncharacterized RDD family membrane protein YckC
LFSVVYVFLSFQHETFEGQSGSGYSYGVIVPTSSISVIILISWTAFITLTEFRYGQSIGKHFVKIKVIRQDSGNTTFLNTFIRHLFDIIDITLLIGLVVALTNKRRQRVGDLVAKTIVVAK